MNIKNLIAANIQPGEGVRFYYYGGTVDMIYKDINGNFVVGMEMDNIFPLYIDPEKIVAFHKLYTN